MKIALLADTHFGVRNDTAAFYDSFDSFYTNTFFPTVDRLKIKHILHLGDVFDRRKYVNFQTLAKTREMFFVPMQDRGMEMKVILGNHDVYYKSTNRLNAVSLLLGEYLSGYNPVIDETLGRFETDTRRSLMNVNNVAIYDKPCEANIFGMDALVLPWINPENYEASMKLIKESRQQLVLGHLEITGFHMYKGMVCDHGVDPRIFQKFEQVLTGHFHHQSKNGPVHYVGAPYEMIWSDFDDPRGFHIMDTETLELEFVQNPDKMFYRVRYDDSADVPGHSRPGPDIEPSPDWKGKYLKIIVIRKKDPYAFDQFMDQVWATQPFDVTLVEDEALDIDKVMDGKEQTLIIDDTPTVLNAYVDAINNIDVNKPALKKLMIELYTEAVASAGRD